MQLPDLTPAWHRPEVLRAGLVALCLALAVHLLPGLPSASGHPALLAAASALDRPATAGPYFQVRLTVTQTFDLGGYRLRETFSTDRVYDLTLGKMAERLLPPRLVPEDEAAWARAGRPIPAAALSSGSIAPEPVVRRWRRHDGWKIGPMTLDGVQVRGLDPTEASLRRWIDAGLTDLLTAPISPALRARIYRDLAGRPGVRVERVSFDGRPAARVRLGPADFHLDPATGAYLGTQQAGDPARPDLPIGYRQRVDHLGFTETPPFEIPT
ncbi:hypothetical protein ACIBG7_32685 [Nonomuraea sp. NPDC050328]|uniref:hypothetical protein n=1 Tax=Nonomuraea sp. NPDC050328 TaxID=3364361 RepID=UPI0037AB7F2A